MRALLLLKVVFFDALITGAQLRHVGFALIDSFAAASVTNDVVYFFAKNGSFSSSNRS